MYRDIILRPRTFQHLYKMFINESGKIKIYDKLFFIVWETHEDYGTKKFIEKYLNMDYIRGINELANDNNL